jgi:imidazolonepropionase-like amidohydrolase
MRALEGILGAVGITLMALGVSAHLKAVSGTAKTGAAATRPASQPGPAAFAVVGARVFDGTAVIDGATVLVESGTIAGVGKNLAIPEGVTVVRGEGKTLLPGLIDAHTHAYQDALERAIVFGVTTEIDMFTDARFAAARRAEQAAGVVAGRADLVSAGILATAPGGHGTEFGIRIPTLTGPSEAQAFVDARVAEGSDFIKIIDDDAASYGLKVPTLSAETIAAVVKAAHVRGKMAVVHVSTSRAAREALEAGADGLAHIVSDTPHDTGLVRLAREHGAFLIPTLAVVASSAGESKFARALQADAALAAYVGASERRSLDATFRTPLKVPGGFERARTLLADFKAAGVRILAGTDAPNPGTAHGVSLHEELELLVGAGLTPAEALAAATSTPAATFGLRDRGRIAPGLRADLVMVDGDPLQSITATRRIAMVWKAGRVVERRTAAAAVAAPPLETDGAVSNFESGLAAGFGHGWEISTDSMMGGSSSASMRVVADGARGSRGSLEISGSMKPGSMYPWAGPMFFPAAEPMSPVNLGRFTALTFWTKGDGATYRVLLFASRIGQVPAEQHFTAGPEWREVTMRFSDFGSGVDGTDLQAVLFSGAAGQSAFRFQIDNVAFK